jgi:CYTH domain-containing protein
MTSLELEKTYLAKSLPLGLEKCPHKEILDIYIPSTIAHPVLRLRKKGDIFEMTKKEPAKDGDASEQTEHTIRLTEEEFKALAAIEGKQSRKIRYDYPYQGHNAEITVFKDELEGLVLIDIEFNDVMTKDSFKIPDFCLADVTQDDTFAGGMLCGKKYADIEEKLEELKYLPLRK